MLKGTYLHMNKWVKTYAVIKASAQKVLLYTELVTLLSLDIEASFDIGILSSLNQITEIFVGTTSCSVNFQIKIAGIRIFREAFSLNDYKI